MEPKQYKVIRVGRGGSAGRCEVGDTVYEQAGYDYGLSSDDERMTGMPHITVTKNSDGSYPGFTIPRMDLLSLDEKANPLAVDPDPSNPKEYKGVIKQWQTVELPVPRKHKTDFGLGYVVRGIHYGFGTEPLGWLRTSYVAKHDKKTGQIETRNSRYTLEGPETKLEL
jgi:hypothetical protein